jgi:hypothetical protein
MSIVEKILGKEENIQQFLNDLNCDKDKWFVFNQKTLENPTLRNFSSKMSFYIMNENTEMFRSRYLFLKFVNDIEVSHWIYGKTKVKDFKIEYEKYQEVENGYIRKNLFEKYDLLDLFSDQRIYNIHYIEALGGVDPHKDPWRYNKNYKNIIFYSNLPEEIKLFVKNKEVAIESPMLTNFGNEKHGYQFSLQPTPLKILHIDYEFP